MKSYADSGFVVSLYKVEATSEEASRAMQRASPPVLLSYLSCLEVRNALHLSVLRQEITEAERRSKWQLFQEDVQAGLYSVMPLPQAELHEKAGELADKYSSTEGSRSLDLLHVAAALLLKAGELLSFDTRQRKIAVSEGLRVRPLSVRPAARR